MSGQSSARCGARVGRLLAPLFVLAAAFGGTTASAQAQKGVVNNVPAELQTVFQTISSAGPLNAIDIGEDLSAQIAHVGDTSEEIYPPGTHPGDYGTFLLINGTLYSSDFQNHGGSASAGIGPYTAFTPVSQSAVTGAGTSASPFAITTVVTVGTTGLSVTQVDSYVVGQESYRTDVTVTNTGNAAVSAIMFRAFDCYLGGSDSGYGVVSGTGPGCSQNPNNVPAGRIEQIVPLNGGNNYYESGYGAVWAWIGTHAAFPDTCDCAINEDNGSGISWNITVPGGSSLTRSNLTVFSPLGNQPLFMSKTADAASATAGGADGYTITVSNPNGAAATLNSVSDTLPAGFTYTAGSTTGATTADPTIAAQTLTWAGPIAVAPGGTAILHFGVTVSSTAGTYTNSATADGGADTVAGTGPTAPITVGGGGGGGGPPAGIPAPTLSEGMLAALILILLAAGVFAGRRARN
jgi:uncharacterized repeat protein (TIGR01451 family)